MIFSGRALLAVHQERNPQRGGERRPDRRGVAIYLTASKRRLFKRATAPRLAGTHRYGWLGAWARARRVEHRTFLREVGERTAGQLPDPSMSCECYAPSIGWLQEQRGLLETNSQFKTCRCLAGSWPPWHIPCPAAVDRQARTACKPDGKFKKPLTLPYWCERKVAFPLVEIRKMWHDSRAAGSDRQNAVFLEAT